MLIKKINLAAFSPTGGTWKVLRHLAAGFSLPKMEYDYSLAGTRPKTIHCSGDQLLLVAFPVYAGLLPKPAEQFFESMQGSDTPAVLVAVYGNREYEGALLDLEKLSVRRGFKPVAAVAAVAEHSMFSDIAPQRPDAADAKRLMLFGKEIERVLLEKSLTDINFNAPGIYHSRLAADPDITRVSADENCVLCGSCVAVCPVGAISGKAPDMTADTCIRCMACVKVCPVNSRGMHNPAVEKVHQWLLQTASERKEAELFL